MTYNRNKTVSGFSKFRFEPLQDVYMLGTTSASTRFTVKEALF